MICGMENINSEPFENDETISKKLEELEQEKEQKIVNLLIEIIISLTWKELYEEGD
jgi:hypothetical protein